MLNLVLDHIRKNGPLDEIKRINLRGAYALGRLASRVANPVCPYTDLELAKAWRDGLHGKDICK